MEIFLSLPEIEIRIIKTLPQVAGRQQTGTEETVIRQYASLKKWCPRQGRYRPGRSKQSAFPFSRAERYLAKGSTQGIGEHLKSNALKIGVKWLPVVLTSKTNTMALRSLNSSSLPLRNSYVNLFQVAQHNLTMWLIEENAARNKTEIEISSIPLSYHTPPPYPRGVNNQR